MALFANFFRKIGAPGAAWAALAVAAVALSSLATPGCGGGGGGDTGPDTTGGQAVVFGTVLNASNGDLPVGGARVEIGGRDDTTLTVDEATQDAGAVGTFRMTGVQQGVNTAIVTVPGQPPQTIAFNPPVGPGTNPALELIVNVGQVRGRVLNPSGQPAAGATVSILATGDTVSADENGGFLFEFVQPGDTRIVAVGSFLKQDGATVIGIADVPVTTTNGLVEAGEITLTEDTNTNPPGSPFTVSGRITTSDGANAGASANVILRRGGVQIEATVADADGSYRFYVPVGTYTVEAIRAGYAVKSGEVTVTNPNTPAALDLVLDPQ